MKKFILLFLIILTIPINSVSAVQADKNKHLINLINIERKSNEIKKLKESNKLKLAACFKLMSMNEYKYFSHYNNGIKNSTPWFFVKVAEYDYQFAGENLAIGYNTASGILRGFMNSESHTKNILNKNFEDVGICSKNIDYMFFKKKVTVVILGKEK